MGGRKFAAYNVADPAPVVAMLAKQPACFDAFSWRSYLLDVHRGTLNDPANRQRLNRGECPDICSDCTVGFQARMLAAGRCHPPASAVVEGLHVQFEGAARAAPESAVDRRGLGVKTSPPGPTFQPSLRGNAQSNSASPSADRKRSAGLCLEREGVAA